LPHQVPEGELDRHGEGARRHPALGRAAEEVDTANVEPMTGAVRIALPRRKDEITDGNCRDKVLANGRRPPTASSPCRRWWSKGWPLHRSHDCRRARRPGQETVLVEELAEAHVRAVEAARGLNAFVTETPDKALEMAKPPMGAAPR